MGDAKGRVQLAVGPACNVCVQVACRGGADGSRLVCGTVVVHEKCLSLEHLLLFLLAGLGDVFGFLLNLPLAPVFNSGSGSVLVCRII